MPSIVPPPMAEWELIITGCGTSHGNPPWGRPDLWSDDPRDQRRRSGAVLRGPAGQVVLIDAGPDLAHQLKDPFRTWDGRSYPADGIVRCDALLLTHDHADHTHGLNDLRHLNRLMGGASIPVHGEAGHLAAVQRMFPYCFGDGGGAYELWRPTLVPRPMADGATIAIAGLPVTPFAMGHGSAGRVTGFRCGGLGYLTDLKTLPSEADPLLQDLDLLAMSMLRDSTHETHQGWDEAQAVLARLRPRRCVLIHMGYEVRWAAWQARLPSGVEMAWDGWRGRFAA